MQMFQGGNVSQVIWKNLYGLSIISVESLKDVLTSVLVFSIYYQSNVSDIVHTFH